MSNLWCSLVRFRVSADFANLLHILKLEIKYLLDNNANKIFSCCAIVQKTIKIVLQFII